jgi:hypothetical protein
MYSRRVRKSARLRMRWSVKPRCQTGSFDASLWEKPPLMRCMAMGEVVRGEDQMDAVGHDDEGVELVEAFGAVVLQGLDEEGGVCVGLEEAAAVVGDGGEEEGAGVGGSRRVRHFVILAGMMGGAEEGRLVVPPAAALRPSAERNPPVRKERVRMGHPARVQRCQLGNSRDSLSSAEVERWQGGAEG